MMNTVLTQQATAAAMVAGVEPAKKVMFLGMTVPQLIALETGIAVGGTLCYVGYKYYKKKNAGGNIFEEKKRLKSFAELKSKQEHVTILDSANLKNWFQYNHVEIEDVKLMIAIPSDKVLNAVGYRLDDLDEDIDRCVIQSIYNSKSGKIYKLRFVNYESIESNLHAKLLENNGLVILDD